MVRHIVLFWLKDNSLRNLIIARDKLRSLMGQIEGLISCEVEIDALHSERSCDLCLNMLFVSQAALDAYRTHPAHLPVQRHMHAVRSQSFAADYPLSRPARRMPALYATLGPSCADADTLRRMFDEGMSGARLTMYQRSLHDFSPWIEAFHTAAARSGIAAELLLDTVRRPVPASDLADANASGFFLSFPHDGEEIERLVASLCEGARVFACICSGADLDAAPLYALRADTLLVERGVMTRTMPSHEIPTLQKRAAALAQALGKPYMVATSLLMSMREHPIPTAAEALDIHNAVLDGASSLLLTDETSIGKYPIESMATLRKTAESAVRF